MRQIERFTKVRYKLRKEENWKQERRKQKFQISKFVFERVEDSIKREGEEGYITRVELIKRLKEAEEEIKKLKAENNLLRKLVENLDRELKLYRAKSFAEAAEASRLAPERRIQHQKPVFSRLCHAFRNEFPQIG